MDKSELYKLPKDVLVKLLLNVQEICTKDMEVYVISCIGYKTHNWNLEGVFDSRKKAIQRIFQVSEYYGIEIINTNKNVFKTVNGEIIIISKLTLNEGKHIDYFDYNDEILN